jgi:myo-inositol-1-phosphate synthase
MMKRVKVAVVGVGNNISALVQGIALHRATGSLVGIHRPVLDGLGVGDIEFVAAFAASRPAEAAGGAGTHSDQLVSGQSRRY